MPQFSFRAECRPDVDQFLARCAAKNFNVKVDIFPHGEGFPDVKVDMIADATIEQLRQTMGEVQDGHVMYQTLRQVPLAQNNLHRDYDLDLD